PLPQSYCSQSAHFSFTGITPLPLRRRAKPPKKYRTNRHPRAKILTTQKVTTTTAHQKTLRQSLHHQKTRPNPINPTTPHRRRLAKTTEPTSHHPKTRLTQISRVSLHSKPPAKATTHRLNPHRRQPAKALSQRLMHSSPTQRSKSPA